MSLDFFFAPLATKVGASLDQVKASQEERRGRRVLGADVSFTPAHHLSAFVISPRQPIHTDTSHTANSKTSFQHLHCVILHCTSTKAAVPAHTRGCARHIFYRAHGAGPPDAMDCFWVRNIFEHVTAKILIGLLVFSLVMGHLSLK